MKPRERFLNLLKHDILKLDLAELNFGVYRILNARRDLVLRFLDEELPAFIADQLATLPGTATEDEEGRIYAALDTFFPGDRNSFREPDRAVRQQIGHQSPARPQRRVVRGVPRPFSDVRRIRRDEIAELLSGVTVYSSCVDVVLARSAQ